MDRPEEAARLRHYGLELIKLAADIEAEHRHRGDFRLPIYQPRFEVIDGVELITNRLACCGSGPDRRDERTGERLHLPGCPKIATSGLADCRSALTGDWTDADDERVQFEELVDAGGLARYGDCPICSGPLVQTVDDLVVCAENRSHFEVQAVL